ncbi:MAG: ABC transporter permease [Bacillota bacterium]|jgi:NitT/TauT family transport system permease protein|nr:ABC transporter permease [Bacillota bacterium]
MRPPNSMSDEHRAFLRSLARRRKLITAARFGLLVALTVLWEVAARLGWINAFIVSSPSRAWQAAANLFNRGELWLHLGMTVGETAIGFTAGTLIGILVAVLLWWSDTLSEILDPYIVVLNAIPKVALGPIFIVWMGTNVNAIIAMAIAVSVIVTIMMMYVGFKEVDPDRVKLLRTFGANRWQILTKVVLPASVPVMIAALKVNVGLSMVGTIVGEFLVSRAGLGFLIVYGGQVFNMSLVMSSVILLSIVSVMLYYGVSALERAVLRSRG